MKRSAVIRGLALVLSLTMCLSLLPFSALAGADDPMALYYDGHRTTYGGEWDYGSTDGYLEQDAAGTVKLSLSGGVPEGNTITAVYLVTADSRHTRKGTIYPVPSGASGGLEGTNGVWVQNVVLTLDAGSYQTEYVTGSGSMYSVDFVDGEFSTPGVVQVVAPGEAPSTLQKPVVDVSGVTTAAVTGGSYRGGSLAATAPNNGALTYQKVSGPDWLSVDPTTGAVTGTPTEAGAYSLCVTAAEAAESRTITSDPAYVTILVRDTKVSFTFSQDLNPDLSNTLTVSQGEKEIAREWIDDGGEVTVSLPGPGSYTAAVTGTYWTSEGERTHTYVDGQTFSAEDAGVTLNVTPSDLRLVWPEVTGSYTCFLEWYDGGDMETANLIHTGGSLMCGSGTYVRAVPVGYYGVEFAPSALTQVQETGSPTLTLTRRETHTVTAGLKDSAGNALSGSVTVTASDRFGNSRNYYGYTSAGGAVSVPGVPMGDGLTVTAVFKADSAWYVSETRTLTADGTAIGDVTLQPRQGYISVPRDAAYSASFQIKKSNGTVLPASMSYDWRNNDYRLYLEDPGKVKAGDTLTVDSYGYAWKAAPQAVKLDADKNGALGSVTRMYGSQLRITGSTSMFREIYFRVFDSKGIPAGSWQNRTSYAGTFEALSGYLYKGTYTVLVTSGEAYPAAAAAKTLNEARELLNAAGNSLYLEKTVSVKDQTTYAVATDVPMGVLPQTYPKATDIEASASGLTLDADGATLSARVTVTPRDTARKDLEVTLLTNQSSDSEDSTPNILNGSVYINGRRAGSDVSIYPDMADHISSFNGAYRITIPDVTEYGGWPAVVQWQSYRTDYEKVTAVALASVGSGSDQYVGEGAVNTPAVSVYAPETTSASVFSVYGNAPKGSTVSITLDGAVAARASTNGTNQFTAQVKLNDPYSWEEHQVGAVVTAGGSTYTAVEKTVIYTPGLPSLDKIYVQDYAGADQLLWDNGTGAYRGYWYYLPENPIRYTVTFAAAGADGNSKPVTDGNAVSDVIVHVPRTDRDVELKAAYRGDGKWVTEEYCCGSNPPTGVWVEYTPKAPEKLFTNADFDKKSKEAAADQADWTAFIGTKNDAAAGNAIDYNTVKAGLGSKITLTGNNSADTREVEVKAGGTAYTVTNRTGTYDAGVITGFEGIFSRGAFENETEQLDGDEYTKLSVENGVPTAVILSRSTSTSYALWMRTTITPAFYTEETWNTKDKSLDTITYKRSAAFDVSEGWNAATQCYAALVAWVNALEQINAVFNDGTPGSITTGESGGSMLRPPASGEAADSRQAETTSAALMDSLPNGVHLSGDGKTAFYQMMAACIEQNVEMDPGGYGPRYESLVEDRDHLGGGLYNNTLWRRGEGFLKEVKKASDTAQAGGKLVGNAIESGVASACRKYVEGKIKKAQNGGWPFSNSKAKEKDRKEMKEAWDRLDQKLTDLENRGIKVDRSLMPPDPMPDENKDDGSGSGTNPPAGQDSNGTASSGTGNPGSPGGTPTDPGGGTPGTPSTPTGPGGPGVPPGQPPANSGPTGIKIPQLFPPKVTLPVPSTRKPVIDPSGVVYEGVKSNRVEGVTATIYAVDNDGTRTVWNAGEFDQINPYTTGGNGFYQWMVPEGKWSVTFTKDGYEAYTTGAKDGSGAKKAGDTYYMPVAPAQLDVNIDLRRSDPPEVGSVKATPDGVYIVFDQYMDTASLTAGRFSLLVDSVEIPLTKKDVIFVNGEDEGGRTYASEVLLKHTIPETAKAALTVDRTVKSYTGKTMNANYVQTNLKVTELAKLAAPSFTPAEGEADVNVPVTISGPTAGAARWPDGTKVYYTTDGTSPTRNSTLYTGPALISGGMTIRAIAVCPGMADSPVASRAGQTSAETVIERVTPAGSRVTVALTCDRPGAAAWCAAYRQDGQMTAVQSETGPFAGARPVVFDLGTADYSFVRVFVLDADGRPLCASVQAGKGQGN